MALLSPSFAPFLNPHLHPDSYLYADAYLNPHPDADAHLNPYTHTYRYSYPHTDVYRHTDGYIHSYPYTQFYTNCHIHSDAGYARRNGHTDPTDTIGGRKMAVARSPFLCYTESDPQRRRAAQVRAERRSVPAARPTGGTMAQTLIRETVLQELEGLAEDRIPEVLDFIRFLKSRQEAERARQRFAVAVEEARAIAREHSITDEDVLEEIQAVRAGQ